MMDKIYLANDTTHSGGFMSTSVYQPNKDYVSGGKQQTGRIQSMDDYQREYDKSTDNIQAYWAEKAKSLDWFKPWDTVHQGDFTNVDFSWFAGGKINACYNAVDRHVYNGKGDQTAVIWAKDEEGEYEHITYKDVQRNVSKMANLFKSYGVQKGDRVCLYLPMIPELMYSMLACARIGAVHSIVFAGFSAEALKGRVEDCEPKLVITSNYGLRGGKEIPLKEITDNALRNLTCETPKVLVTHRVADKKVNWVQGRDLNYEEEIIKHSAVCPVEWTDAEDPLFILYTSGSTGTPKGLLHTTGGYLTYTSTTHKEIFNYQEGQTYFCAADIGWVTGHSYIIYGPMVNGATTVMFESTPTYPNAGRYWKVIQDLKVDIFYTAPTALRALAQAAGNMPKEYDLSSLKVLGTVGEPINPEIWEWYYDVVGDKKCSIVDTWWQTETGGVLITPLPLATPMKAGSATKPFFGIKPVLVEPESGKLLEGNDVQGALCMAHSWPSQARTIYGDHARFIETYFSQYKGYYFTGDGCKRDADGDYWIIGRIDDVLNVSGHRLGTAEIESCLIEHPDVAEAAVVGYNHKIKGIGIYAYIVPKGTPAVDEKLLESIKDQVRSGIGRFAAPDVLQMAPGLPKTRSGKVMRRILRKIAGKEYDQLGDISTLLDPQVVTDLTQGNKKLDY
jgi:acetyl-CoA synthetase